MEPLHTKYRPVAFDEVIGQDATVKSLKEITADKAVHTFLFTGPSGTGKTTLARIVAAEVGCRALDLIEIDAATNTGVDDMRKVTAALAYRPMGDSGVKAIVVDECHMLSKSAWNSMLKVLEEPPEWVYWFLCTTEPARVPASIKTRCATYILKEVGRSELQELLTDVVDQEQMDLGKDPESVIQICAKEAGGSPRQALVNIAMCAGVENVKQARELLRAADQAEEVINLARALVKGAKWAVVQQILVELKDHNPESIRHVIRAYVTKVVLGAKSEQSAGHGLEILDAFSEPCNPSDGMTPIVLACGQITLG